MGAAGDSRFTLASRLHLKQSTIGADRARRNEVKNMLNFRAGQRSFIRRGDEARIIGGMATTMLKARCNPAAP